MARSDPAPQPSSTRAHFHAARNSYQRDYHHQREPYHQYREHRYQAAAAAAEAPYYPPAWVDPAAGYARYPPDPYRRDQRRDDGRYAADPADPARFSYRSSAPRHNY